MVARVFSKLRILSGLGGHTQLWKNKFLLIQFLQINVEYNRLTLQRGHSDFFFLYAQYPLSV